MLYNRQQMCTLSGTALDTFKNSNKVNPKTGFNNLPFARPDPNFGSDRDEETRSGYFIYSAFDVICMALATEGSGPAGYLASSLSFATAAEIVRNHHASILAAVDRILDGERDIFIGYGAYADAGGRNLFGTLAEISSKSTGLSRMFLINVSEAMAATVLRADAAGLEFNPHEILGDTSDAALVRGVKFRMLARERAAKSG